MTFGELLAFVQDGMRMDTEPDTVVKINANWSSGIRAIKVDAPMFSKESHAESD